MNLLEELFFFLGDQCGVNESQVTRRSGYYSPY